MSGISKEGKKFIEELDMYLVSTGKSEEEIKEFIQEVEEHLILSEKEGKNVVDIFGDSPEGYAESVAREISYNIKDILKTIAICMLGFGSWIFLGRIDNRVFEMSPFEALCTPITFVITMLLGYYTSQKYAFKEKKRAISIYLILVLNIFNLMWIKLVGKNMDQSIVLSTMIVNIIIIIMFIALIVISKRINTWILMIPFVWYIGVVISNFTNLDLTDNSLLNIISSILGLVFIFIDSKQ